MHPLCYDDYNLGFADYWELSSTGSATPGRYIKVHHSTGGAVSSNNQPCECETHDSLSLVAGMLDFFTLPGGQSTAEDRMVFELAPGP